MAYAMWFDRLRMRLSLVRYPAKITEVGSQFVITFRDFPGIIDYAHTLGWARARAVDTLLSAAEGCFLRMEPMPKPSRIREGEEMVQLGSETSYKVRLANFNLRWRADSFLPQLRRRPRANDDAY